ncbi:MAG: hypothetical protein K1X74_14875 [Pirellulales bacterium]|nr:hypothetical protein [Pirellulales bacterium]
MTLAELLMAMVITGLLAGIAAGMANATFQGHRYSRGRSDATQHARVACERMALLISQAYASPTHPGVAVVYKTVGSEQFPDTLVIWTPTGSPVNTAGPPQISECVFICCDPAAPQRLIELRAPGDTRTLPLDDTINDSANQAIVAALKVAPTSTVIELTPLVRTFTVSSTSLGAVRFERKLHPTTAEWTSYQANTLAFSAMSWPRDLWGATVGMRQCTVRYELQLMPGDEAVLTDPQGVSALPFLGSATFYDDLKATH